MKPSQALNKYKQAILNIMAEHHAENVRVFGSVLSNQDTELSDLDLLVDPLPSMTLMDIGAIRYELKSLLGLEVDILTPNALPNKFKQTILSQAKPI